MLVDNETREFESNTNGGTSAFTIAASSKAFQILSNQIYTDKPRAILRELSTNALDAHIAAGKADVPFEVQLPTTWDTTLIVKDFGTGMSPEQIEHLYCTYFGSDKTHTNDLVGGLGLGSKSPFSYTDQFTAVSRHNGTKYTYAAFIGAANVPEISLISTEKTDEENGFEVHVPVKESDIWVFERTAKRVFEFFDVKPILNQSIDFTVYDEPVMTINFDGVECSLYPNQARSLVMQGPIGYPIDAMAITSELDYGERSKVDQFYSKGWRIKASVGTFEITASREALSYDKKTIARLLEVAEGVLAEVREKTIDELKACQDIKSAVELLTASSKYLPSQYTLKNVTWNGLEWNGNAFHVDLPPDTRCREIRKRQYSRSSDPHQTDIHDESIFLGNWSYRIYWSEKHRPFKQFMIDNPVADKYERILYFTGPLVSLKNWLKSIGLPEGSELPKAIKAPSTPGAKKVNYGATEYQGYCLQAGLALKARGNLIIEEPNAHIVVCESHQEMYAVREEYKLMVTLDLLKGTVDDTYVFYIPEHHSKVTKAIKEHPGYVGRTQVLKLLCKPAKHVYKKIAMYSAMTKAFQIADKYTGLVSALDPARVTEPEVVKLLELLANAAATDKGSISIWTIKNRLAPYDIDLDNNVLYNGLVDKFTRAATQELNSLWGKYGSVLQLALDGYNDCHYSGTWWRGKESVMRKIVTEWVNTGVEALSSTQQQQEAA